MISGPVISAEQAVPALEGAVILDARAGPRASAAYQEGRVRGAIHVDLEKDLSELGDPSLGGRHPLPALERWAERVGAWGITPSTRVLIYDSTNGGMAAARAWWMLDLERAEVARAQGPRSYAGEVPPGMEAATDQVVEMLAELQEELAVPDERLIVGGFSQGSMAACNAVFTRNVDPAALVILSGTPVNLSAWEAGMPRRQNLRVLQSHGERDLLLSFQAAQDLRNAMRAAGLQTEWIPFKGGHEIPMPVMDGLSRFLRDIALRT